MSGVKFVVLVWLALPVVTFAQTSTAYPWPRVQPAVFVDLEYPREALAARVHGRVIVSVETDDAGRVVEAKALAGRSALATAAVANARQWTLSPGVGTGAIVYHFEIGGYCRDDSHSLFRLTKPNLAVITACEQGSERPVTTSADDDLPYWASRGVHPRYPPIWNMARYTAVIVLELTVRANGRVEPRALTDDRPLAPVAVEHARQWRVEPVRPGRYYEVYEFALDNNACGPKDSGTAFWQVTPGYWRLSGCAPVVGGGWQRPLPEE